MMFIPRLRPSINFKNLSYIDDSKDHISLFEKSFNDYIGGSEAIAVCSARTGLYLSLNALDIKKGDEMILSSYNFPLIPNLLICMGIKPIFIDVDEQTYNINTRQIEKSITKRTKAILVTHVEGNPCNMDEILKISRKHNLKIIEDCAHSLGAEYKNKKTGVFGDAAIFSFGLGKHINSLGGGMITLKNKTTAKKIRKALEFFKEQNKIELTKRLTKHKIISALSEKHFFPILTWPVICFSLIINLDLTKSLFEESKTFQILPKPLFTKYSQKQAEIGLEQFKELPEKIEIRNNNAFVLKKKLKRKIKFQKTLNNGKSAWLNFTVRTKKRQELIKKLIFQGIDTQATWMKSCSSLPFFKDYKNYCPVSDSLEKEGLYIPIYPGLEEKERIYLFNTLNSLINFF